VLAACAALALPAGAAADRERVQIVPADQLLAKKSLVRLGDLGRDVALVLLGVDEHGAAVFAADPGGERAAALDPGAAKPVVKANGFWKLKSRLLSVKFEKV
jgi:hypothetical protein